MAGAVVARSDEAPLVPVVAVAVDEPESLELPHAPRATEARRTARTRARTAVQASGPRGMPGVGLEPTCSEEQQLLRPPRLTSSATRAGGGDRRRYAAAVARAEPSPSASSNASARPRSPLISRPPREASGPSAATQAASLPLTRASASTGVWYSASCTRPSAAVSTYVRSGSPLDRSVTVKAAVPRLCAAGRRRPGARRRIAP